MKNKIIMFVMANVFAIGLNADQIKLTVKKDELREENGKVLFEPERSRMKAKYDTYVFEKENFISKVGDLESITGTFSILVDSKPGSVKSVNPEGGAVPQGGIKIKYFEAKIIKKQ